MHLKIPLCAYLSLLLAACSPSQQPETAYDQALAIARGHRSELEKVVEHYRTEGDTLKMQAAVFLIRNMPGKGSFIPADPHLYQTRLQQMGQLDDPNPWNATRSHLAQQINTLQQEPGMKLTWIRDLDTQTADLLIRHIDRAFALWEATPWRSRYSFEEFCEWVLPYRIGMEKNEDWLALAQAQPQPTEAWARAANDPFGLGLILINHTGMRYNAAMGSYPYALSFSEATQLKWGTCNQMTDYAVKLFRSRGLPAAADIILSWADRGAGHQWNVLVGPDSTSRDIGYDPAGRNIFEFRISKIYRQTFVLQKGTPIYKYRESESVPRYFKRYDLADVTSQYDMPLATVTIPDLDTTLSRIAYLATFDNREWFPMAYAEIKNGQATFRNVGCGHRPRRQPGKAYIGQGSGIVYLPCYYINGRVVPASDPILVDADRRVTPIRPDTTQTQSITLTRKYPESRELWSCKQNMVGGRFEGANSPDFRDAVPLYHIARLPGEGIERQTIHATGPYRYLRYVHSVPSDTIGSDIAEIAFFSDTLRLSGIPLRFCGTTPARPEEEEAGPAFDSEILTYYHHTKDPSSYIGLDLGTPRQITAVEYAPRTDDNGIVPGQSYELYSWENGKWHTLGRQTAAAKHLTYSNVPEGALLLLRNRTKGVENRLFTLSSGRQVWW